MKKTLKVFAFSMLITIFITNICYAATLTNQQLNTSLKKMFSNEIKIVQDSTSESITLQGQEVDVRGNQIKLVDSKTKKPLNIYYTIENNICKFESTIELGINASSSKEDALEAFSIMMYQVASYDICYLAVADALGVDLSLAYTYYAQNYNNDSIDVQTKIYSIETNLPKSGNKSSSLDVSTMVLKVDCSELAQLSSGDVNQADTYTVKVMSDEGNITPPVEDENKDNTQVQNPVTNQNTQQNTQTSQSNKGQGSNTTTADREIPKAGMSEVVIVAIFMVIIVAIITYTKNKKYQDIK